jgi:hypothetical protein
MRWTIGFFVLLATPAFAANPVCALPGPTAMTSNASPPRMAAVSVSAPAPAGKASGITLPPVLAAVPFAEHVAAAGATVTNLSAVHGLPMIAAKSGSQFMLFEVTPDGKAGVSGVPIDLSLAELRSVAGANITDVGVEHGLHGYFVRSGQQFQVFYATPDGKGLIPGVMWDASGHDVTRQQVSKIPGAIPTIEVGTADSRLAASGQALPLLEKATYGTIGPSSAPKVYMFIDPQCIYSIRTFQELRPYAEAGRLQLAVIPLSVLDYEDKGQSTRSALALLSDAPGQIVSAWQSGSVSNAPGPDAPALLRKNMEIAQAVGLKGTPMLWWQRPNGSVAHLDGVPTNVAQFIAGLGS